MKLQSIYSFEDINFAIDFLDYYLLITAGKEREHILDFDVIEKARIETYVEDGINYSKIVNGITKSKIVIIKEKDNE